MPESTERARLSERPTPRVARSAITPPTTAVRVLLVDDDEGFRTLVRELLGSVQGAEVVGEAKDGAEAVKLAKTLRPDVILMDFQMPGLDGAAAALEIATVLPATRIVILSGTDSARPPAKLVPVELVPKDGVDSEVLAHILRPAREQR